MFIYNVVCCRMLQQNILLGVLQKVAANTAYSSGVLQKFAANVAYSFIYDVFIYDVFAVCCRKLQQLLSTQAVR